MTDKSLIGEMKTGDQPAFEYQALEPNSRQIRLAALHPATASNIVDLSLEVTSLDEKPAYEALSYTWGNPSDTVKIKLNGYLFSVNRNLAMCLHELREDRVGAALWIDAVCVNQEDEQEKSSQVQQMKEIYENASKIVIWLGEASEDSSCAMKMMSDFHKFTALTSTCSMTQRDPRDQKKQALDPKAEKALGLILKRPWWCRAWIIQEATCPNETSLRCGGDEINFKAVVASVKFILKCEVQRALERDFSNPDITDMYRVIAMDKIRLNRNLNPNGHSDFLSLLSQSRNCKASDPRDKLFALSGLANKAQKRAVNPDYSLRLDQVYKNFTCIMIETEKNLNIFGHCQQLIQSNLCFSRFELLRQSLRPDRPLPFWTPDWTLDLETTPFIKNEKVDDASSRKIYRSSNDTSPCVQLDEHRQILSVRGFIFDTVKEVAPGSESLFDAQKLNQWYIWLTRELGEKYHTMGTTHEAALHTFVADIGIADKRYRRGSTAPWPVSMDGTDESFRSNSLVKMALHSRGVFISELGYMGLARWDVRKGDDISILLGGQVPFILRQHGDTYQLKSECYVHGVMDGEAMTPRIWQDFALQ